MRCTLSHLVIENVALHGKHKHNSNTTYLNDLVLEKSAEITAVTLSALKGLKYTKITSRFLCCKVLIKFAIRLYVDFLPPCRSWPRPSCHTKNVRPKNPTVKADTNIHRCVICVYTVYIIDVYI